MEKKRGGRREGAGRPSIGKYKKRLNFCYSEESKMILNKYSECLGVSKSDLADQAVLELPNMESIIKCPNCGSPLLWLKHIPKDEDIRCRECGKVYLKSEIIKNK